MVYNQHGKDALRLVEMAPKRLLRAHNLLLVKGRLIVSEGVYEAIYNEKIKLIGNQLCFFV